MKRKWEDRTQLEEMLIYILHEIAVAVDQEDHDKLIDQLEDYIDVLEGSFVAIPWEQSANDQFA
jgi:hypothetical protein